MSEYDFHPAADLFPMLSTDELKELANDIKVNGLNHPIVLHDGKILDGRNRYRACGVAQVEPTFTVFSGNSPVAFVVSENIHRRHLSTSQKAGIAVEIEPLFAEEARARQVAAIKERDDKGRAVSTCVNIDTTGDDPPAEEGVEDEHTANNSPSTKVESGKARDQAAQVMGVSSGLVANAKAVKEESPELFEKVKDGTMTVSRAKKENDKKKKQKQLEEAQKRMTEEKRTDLSRIFEIRHCSCRELFASGIKPDAVITDPPYPYEFIDTFSELAECCAEAGVPMVAVMSGQSYLQEVMSRLSERLKYRWMMAYMTPGGQAVQLWQARVNTFWKPVFIYGQVGDDTPWIGDVAVSKTNDNDKRFHGWGQSESGMAELIEKLTKPGYLVCDPFAGGGTTAIACLALGRRFIGCDIDLDCVENTRTRIEANYEIS